MWRYESLILLYAFAGLAVWTWVFRNHPPRAKLRARGMNSLRRRLVEGIGVSTITLVALLLPASASWMQAESPWH